VLIIGDVSILKVVLYLFLESSNVSKESNEQRH
jgi:hypothetical protein